MSHNQNTYGLTCPCQRDEFFLAYTTYQTLVHLKRNLTCRFDKILGQSSSGTSLSILITSPVQPPSGSILICEGAMDITRGTTRPRTTKSVRFVEIILNRRKFLFFSDDSSSPGNSLSLPVGGEKMIGVFSGRFDQICHCIYFLMTRSNRGFISRKKSSSDFSFFRLSLSHEKFI